MAAQVGLSYKETAETITSFLEISLHTILCLRSIYPPSTFTRRRSHGVPVYQSRHPQVQSYISEICSVLGKEIERGNARRVSVVIKDLGGLPLERWVFDLGYLGVGEGREKEAGLVGAPGAEELSLMLRGFLIRLTALDGQLLDIKGEATFAVIIETKDDLEPSTNTTADGSVPPWIPAMAADTIRPRSQVDGDRIPHHEPLLHVKAIETGVIDIRLMVQECVAKTGVEHLEVMPG